MLDNKVILSVKTINGKVNLRAQQKKINMTVLPPQLTLTDVERAEEAANIAMSWAQSTESPDGQDDQASPTGKTRSAKSWALSVKQDAENASVAAVSAATSEANSANSALAAENIKKDVEEIAGNLGDPVIEVSENAGTITVKNSLGKTITFKVVKTVNGNAPDGSGNVDVSGNDENTIETLIKSEPDYYQRMSLPLANKQNITIKAGTKININNKAYIGNSDVVLNLSNVGSANTVKGKDVYIYACQPNTAESTEPVFVLSVNKAVPDGYTSQNSRKIGGFHCLCADVGVIDGHPLSGYVAGDILPASVWDLIHRPRSSPEGMVYVDGANIWMDIYLNSWDGAELVSLNNGNVADGKSTKPWHGEAMIEQLMMQKKRLPWRAEFQIAAKGSNEQTTIAGSADPITTGGHLDSAGRRIISNCGIEDACGTLWQWTMDLCPASGNNWAEDVYNEIVDDRCYGNVRGKLCRLVVGGAWGDSVNCGSRSVSCNYVSAEVQAYISARGVSEPLS